LKFRPPEAPRILLVVDDDALAKELAPIFRRESLDVERVRSVTAGCDSARSGHFQVVVAQPELADGSWKRLADLASHYRPGFVVILVAKTFDLQQWARALEEGAFDVLDALHDLPKAAETALRALWAAYLTGAELSLEAANSLKSS
jgi:DNA-binding NtrC family response regulator